MGPQPSQVGVPTWTPPSPPAGAAISQWGPERCAVIGAHTGRGLAARAGGAASAVSAVIREGKVACAGGWVGARSYGSRSGGAGPQKTGGGGGSPRERDYVPLGVSL